MSKLDWLTIVIVAVCIAALIWLFRAVINMERTELPIENTTQYDEQGEATEDVYDPYDPSHETLNRDTIDETTVNIPTEDATDPDDENVRTFNEDKYTPSREEVIVPDEMRPQPLEGDLYLVLAGSFRQRTNAETEVTRLKGLGYDQAEVALFNNGAFASALVGRFSSYDEAKQVVKVLKEKYGIEAIVQEKR